MATKVEPTAEERLEIILSNQYHHRMHRNRPTWYKDCQPLDTAPKCFKPPKRNDTRLVGDWRACAHTVAVQAKCTARRFHDAHYEINGAVWDWSDPSADVIVELMTSRTIETIEFVISNDPFYVPHIFVSHSEGEEPHCLDATGNPDTLGDAPSTSIQSISDLCGFTPRQCLLSPAGKEQLFLPPRAFSATDRDSSILEYTLATTRRQTTLRRRAGEFHAGLRRIRARLAAGLDPAGDDKLAGLGSIEESDELEDDFQPMSQEELVSQGLSERTECPLTRLGIFQQEDIAAMAESALVSSDSEGEEEEEEGQELAHMVPRSPGVSGDTCAVLRRLGLLDSDSDSDSTSDEDEGPDDSDLDSDESDDDTSSDADISFGSSTTITVSKARVQAFPASAGCLNLAQAASDADEEASSSSSLFVDEESDSDSGCESPDTEDDC